MYTDYKHTSLILEMSFLLCSYLWPMIAFSQTHPPLPLCCPSHTYTLTATLLQTRPRCLATPCRVAQGAGTRHLASAVITVHTPVYRPRLCMFLCTPGVSACVCLCVVQLWEHAWNTSSLVSCTKETTTRGVHRIQTNFWSFFQHDKICIVYNIPEYWRTSCMFITWF